MTEKVPCIKWIQCVASKKTCSLSFTTVILLMIMLSASIQSVVASTCPSSVSNSGAITTEQYSFSGSSSTLTIGVAVGKVSNSLYFTSRVNAASTYTVVVKIDATGTQIWTILLNFNQSTKSLSVDTAEQRVYLSSFTSPLVVVSLSTSSGAIKSQQSLTGIRESYNSVKIWPLNDSSGYFVIGFDNLQNVKICKYIFSSSSAQCQTVFKTMYDFGSLMLSQNQFFLLGSDPSALVFHMYKVSFLSTSVDWANKMLCSSYYCDIYPVESLLSIDGSNIYSFLSYQTAVSFYFLVLSASSGNVATTRYKSIFSTYPLIYGSAINKDYVIASTNNINSLMIYNILLNTFTISSYSSMRLYGCAVESSSGRFVVVGGKGSLGYTAKFIPQSISLNSDFSTGTFSMTALAAGQEDIIAEAGVTISAADSPFIPTAGTYTNLSTSYVSVSSTTSDVYYQILAESLSVIELNTLIATVQLSCSYTGSTSISYSISGYGSSTVPSWVAINSTTGILTITAPSVSADTEFDFDATSSIYGVSSPVQKLIKLTVINCQVQNCNKCSNLSISTCVSCNSDYTLNSGSCIIASSTSQALSSTSTSQVLCSTSTSALGASFGVISLMSLINPASIASLWGMLNQAQLFFLILLTRASIPLDVQNVITSAKFSLNIASYIFIPNYGFLSLTIGQFDFNLSDKTLKLLSINSYSSLFNFFPIIILIFIMILLHLLVMFFYKLMPIDDSDEWKCNCMLFVKFINKLFAIMTYGLYIRYIFETNQYILISVIYEIYHFNVSDTKKIASLIFAILILCLCIFLVIFVFCLSLSSYEVIKDSHNKIGEIFSGIKMQKMSKLYVAILLIRRVIFITLLITLVFIPPWIVICILSLLQICYLTLLIVVRPFESKKNNIIEITNEIFFTILLSSLTYFNSEKDWSSQITQIYMWIITSNSFVTFLIIIIDAIRTLILSVKKRCSKSQQSDRTVAPIASRQITVVRPTKDFSCRSVSEIESRISKDQVNERNKKYLSEESQIIIEGRKIVIEARRFNNNPFKV